MNERRMELRMLVSEGAKIATSDPAPPVDCKVLDVSLTGARLEVDGAVEIPQRFDLIFNRDGIRHPCQIIWSKDKLIGVEFEVPPYFDV